MNGGFDTSLRDNQPAFIPELSSLIFFHPQYIFLFQMNITNHSDGPGICTAEIGIGLTNSIVISDNVHNSILSQEQRAKA